MNEKTERQKELEELERAWGEIKQGVRDELMGSVLRRIVIPVNTRIIKILRWISRRKT